MNRIKHIRSYVFALFIVFVLSVFCGIKLFIADVDAADNRDTGTVNGQTVEANSDHSQKAGIDILKTAKKRKKISIADSKNSDGKTPKAKLSPSEKHKGSGMIALKKLDEEQVQFEGIEAQGHEHNVSVHNKQAKKGAKKRLVIKGGSGISVHTHNSKNK